MIPQHRVPALRFALVAVIVWSTVTILRPQLGMPLLVGAIIFALFALFLLSPWADRIENRER